MPALTDAASPERRAEFVAYWPLPLARAVVAAVVAVVVTFSADHSAAVGLGALGGFAVGWGAVTGVLVVRRMRRTALYGPLVVQSGASLALGVASLLVIGLGVPALLVLLGSWTAVVGLLELYGWVRARRRHPAAGDALVVAVLALVAAVVFALLPPDLADTFTDAGGAEGVIDSAVVAVGLLGALAAIVAVFLAIAAFSARSAARTSPPMTGAATASDPPASRAATASDTPASRAATGRSPVDAPATEADAPADRT